MVTTGYSYAVSKHIHQSLICGCCGKYLGSYDIENGKEYNEIEGWLYCPFCGRELELDMDLK